MRSVFAFQPKWLVLFSIAASLLLTGCARSPVIYYYLLSAITSDQPENNAAVSPEVIGIGPVHLAEYLDRPQLVKRLSSNRLQFAENFRWAESLDNSIPRIIEENLAVLLPDATFLRYPWNPSSAFNLQLTLEIIRFELDAGNDAVAEIRWQIKSSEGKLLMPGKKDIFKVPVEGQSLDAKVSALSKTLSLFSRQCFFELVKQQSNHIVPIK